MKSGNFLSDGFSCSFTEGSSKPLNNASSSKECVEKKRKTFYLSLLGFKDSRSNRVSEIHVGLSGLKITSVPAFAGETQGALDVNKRDEKVKLSKSLSEVTPLSVESKSKKSNKKPNNKEPNNKERIFKFIDCTRMFPSKKQADGKVERRSSRAPKRKSEVELVSETVKKPRCEPPKTINTEVESAQCPSAAGVMMAIVLDFSEEYEPPKTINTEARRAETLGSNGCEGEAASTAITKTSRIDTLQEDKVKIFQPQVREELEEEVAEILRSIKLKNR